MNNIPLYLNALPEAVCVVNLDAQIIDVNKTFERLLMRKSHATNLNFLRDLFSADSQPAIGTAFRILRTTAEQFDAKQHTDRMKESSGGGNSSVQNQNADDTMTDSFANQTSNSTPPATSTSAEKVELDDSGFHAPVSLGFVKTLSLLPPHNFPIYRPFEWWASLVSVPSSTSTPMTTALDDHVWQIILTGRFAGDKNPKSEEAEHFESELVDFFQNAPIALHWLSGTGHVLWANNTELESLGYKADEYIGHSILEFCPEEVDHVLSVFQRLSAGQTIRNESFKFRTKSGDAKYLVVDSNVSWHADGSFKHTRCFIRDDTRRRIDEAVREAEWRKMIEMSAVKDEYVRRLFHELRTPLHIMADLLGPAVPAWANQQMMVPGMASASISATVAASSTSSPSASNASGFVNRLPIILDSLSEDLADVEEKESSSVTNAATSTASSSVSANATKQLNTLAELLPTNKTTMQGLSEPQLSQQVLSPTVSGITVKPVSQHQPSSASEAVQNAVADSSTNNQAEFFVDPMGVGGLSMTEVVDLRRHTENLFRIVDNFAYAAEVDDAKKRSMAQTILGHDAVNETLTSATVKDEAKPDSITATPSECESDPTHLQAQNEFLSQTQLDVVDLMHRIVEDERALKFRAGQSLPVSVEVDEALRQHRVVLAAGEASEDLLGRTLHCLISNAIEHSPYSGGSVTVKCQSQTVAAAAALANKSDSSPSNRNPVHLINSKQATHMLTFAITNYTRHAVDEQQLNRLCDSFYTSSSAKLTDSSASLSAAAGSPAAMSPAQSPQSHARVLSSMSGLGLGLFVANHSVHELRGSLQCTVVTKSVSEFKRNQSNMPESSSSELFTSATHQSNSSDYSEKDELRKVFLTFELPAQLIPCTPIALPRSAQGSLSASPNLSSLRGLHSKKPSVVSPFVTRRTSPGFDQVSAALNSIPLDPLLNVPPATAVNATTGVNLQVPQVMVNALSPGTFPASITDRSKCSTMSPSLMKSTLPATSTVATADASTIASTSSASSVDAAVAKSTKLQQTLANLQADTGGSSLVHGKLELIHGASKAAASVSSTSDVSSSSSSATAVKSVASLLKTRVLVVDDSPICQKVLDRALTLAGYDCSTACNGQDALDKLKAAVELNRPFDAVFMDLRMPIMDGITATRLIRQELKLTVPIIVVTAEFGQETRDEAAAAGASDFLGKPAPNATVVAALKKQLSSQILMNSTQ